MKHYCLYCGWNANVEFFERPLGTKWVCKGCGNSGHKSDFDCPILVNENEQGNDESDYDFAQRIFTREKDNVR